MLKNRSVFDPNLSNFDPEIDSGNFSPNSGIFYEMAEKSSRDLATVLEARFAIVPGK